MYRSLAERQSHREIPNLCLIGHEEAIVLEASMQKKKKKIPAEIFVLQKYKVSY